MRISLERRRLLKKLILNTYLPAVAYFAWHFFTPYPNHWPEALGEEELMRSAVLAATTSGTAGVIAVWLHPFLRRFRRRRRRVATNRGTP